MMDFPPFFPHFPSLLMVLGFVCLTEEENDDGFLKEM